LGDGGHPPDSKGVIDVKKRIGILGGISAEATAEYYTRIIRGYYERKRDYYYPEIVIFSLDFQRFTDYENSGDSAGYVAEIMSGIHVLERAGAEFVIMAANSPHAVFDEVEARANAPMLSIVRVTAEEARSRGLDKLLLLGIKFTMQATFYRDTCRELGIEVLTPTEAEQDEINRIIFEELARGIIKETSRERLIEIIRQYPASGVILGCTELPLILKQKDTSVTLLDTLELHTRAALDYALGEAPLFFTRPDLDRMRGDFDGA
jgi:aspartate racemase